jgi:hypothetical protein
MTYIMRRDGEPEESPLETAALTLALEGLTTAEALAMHCLMKGGNITAAAVAAEVTRMTIYEWLEPGRPLAVALDTWKRDLANTARTRLLLLSDVATQNVRAALMHGDTRTALKVLEKMGILDSPPVGPSESEVRAQRERHKTEQSQRKARDAERVDEFISPWPMPSAGPVRKEGQSDGHGPV